MRPAPGVFPFIDTVRLLAAKHGLDVEINEEWLPGYGADVLVKRRSAEVSVSLALLAQPAAVQEFAAAHEIAHVVLRHMFWRRILPAAAWAVTLAVLVFVGLWLAVHHLTAPAPPLVLVLGGLGLLGAGIGCLGGAGQSKPPGTRTTPTSWPGRGATPSTGPRTPPTHTARTG